MSTLIAGEWGGKASGESELKFVAGLTEVSLEKASDGRERIDENHRWVGGREGHCE